MTVSAPNLDFTIDGVEIVPSAAIPTLTFRLHARCASRQTIHSTLLRCQILIETTRRRYSPLEQQKLSDLFGQPSEWERSLRGLPWTSTVLYMPQFSESILQNLPVTCPYDFNLAATSFFNAVENGDVPLCFLFSGTVFYAGETGALQVAPIPWSKQAYFRLPVAVWREMMDRYYSDTVWLDVPKSVFERLLEFKRRNALPTWKHAMERLLETGAAIEPDCPANAL